MSARHRPTWQAWQNASCPPWCAFDGDHTDRDAYDDRVHASEHRDIILTAEDPTRWQDGNGGWHVLEDSPTASVNLVQHYREAEPRVWVGRDDTNQGLHYTLAEARRLADELVRAADMAEGHCGPDSATSRKR